MKFGVIILLALNFGFSNKSLTQKSPIYNSNFQLIADTNYQLSKLEFEEWSYIENRFLYVMATQYGLPAIITDYRLDLRGIFEFKYSPDSGFYAVQFHPYKFAEREQLLIEAVIIPSYKSFLTLFEEENKWSMGELEISEATFYLPFSFKAKLVKEQIDSNGYFISNEVYRALIDKKR